MGIAPGWHCLEVGAGGGSITRWMAGHVGPTGRVVATDLDPVFVEELPRDNLVALRHDIATEDLPGESFDLVHCRDVLMHVSNATAALNRMVGALRPGGWLFIEEKDVVILRRLRVVGATIVGGLRFSRPGAHVRSRRTRAHVIHGAHPLLHPRFEFKARAGEPKAPTAGHACVSTLRPVARQRPESPVRGPGQMRREEA